MTFICIGKPKVHVTGFIAIFTLLRSTSLKIPPPNMVTLGVRVSTHEFSRHNSVHSNTSGPQITLFHSTSFCYKVDEENNRFPARSTVWKEFAHSPHVCVGFLLVLRFPPTSQRCAHEVNWHV